MQTLWICWKKLKNVQKFHLASFKALLYLAVSSTYCLTAFMSFGFAAKALAASFILFAAVSTLVNTALASAFVSAERSELLISFFAASMLALYDGASVVGVSLAAASSSALVFSAPAQYSVFQVVYSCSVFVYLA